MCFFHVLRIVPYVNHHQTDPPFRGIPGFSHLVCKMCGFLFHPKKPNKRQKILHIWIFSRVCVIVSKNILSKGRFPSHVIVCRILHHLNGNINTYLAILHNLFDFQEGFFFAPILPGAKQTAFVPGFKKLTSRLNSMLELPVNFGSSRKRSSEIGVDLGVFAVKFFGDDVQATRSSHRV